MKRRIGDDGHRIREVQAPNRPVDRNTPGPSLSQEIPRKPLGLTSKNQDISLCKRAVHVTPLTASREQVHLPGTHPCPEFSKISVFLEIDVLPVVEPRPTNRFVIGLEAQGMDKMEPSTDPKTESPNVARIRANLWFHQCDMETGLGG